jgi:hypothetical protein
MSCAMPIIFGVLGLGCAVVGFYGIARGPGEIHWVASPFLLCLVWLVMGAFMHHCTQIWKIRDAERLKSHELQVNLGRLEVNYTLAKDEIHRLRKQTEAQVYNSDVIEYGEQTARLRRVERQLKRDGRSEI